MKDIKYIPAKDYALNKISELIAEIDRIKIDYEFNGFKPKPKSGTIVNDCINPEKKI